MKSDQAKKYQNNFGFEIVLDEKTGKKKMALNSMRYFQHFLDTKTKVGDKGSFEPKFEKPTRSAEQLRYYAVLVGLIADYTGYTWDETHEALMKLKWGTKKVVIDGEIVEVRRSLSNKAKFPKGDMVEQIDFALEKCKKFEIHVPTMQELGYVSNYQPYGVKV